MHKEDTASADSGTLSLSRAGAEGEALPDADSMLLNQLIRNLSKEERHDIYVRVQDANPGEGHRQKR